MWIISSSKKLFFCSFLFFSAKIEIKRSSIESTTTGIDEASERIRFKIPSLWEEIDEWCGDECLVDIHEVGNEIFVCCCLFLYIEELLQTLLKWGELKKNNYFKRLFYYILI